MEIKEEFQIEEPCVNNIKREELTENGECPNKVPSLDKKSRKIQKKREKYHKIDDNIRLQLLEAVNKNGELLKTAAKRLNVNYSSAKSIFFTYRKEGRIVKKTVKNRANKKDSTFAGGFPLHNHQVPQNSWTPNPLRWFGGANAFFQNFSRPLFGTFGAPQANRVPINMSNQIPGPEPQQKSRLNSNLIQVGLPNNIKQQLGSLILSNRTETPCSLAESGSKPASNLLSNFGIFPGAQIQNIFNVIKNPITGLSSLVGNQYHTTNH